MVIRGVLLFFVYFFSYHLYGQNQSVIRNGLLRAQANIASGKMIHYNQGSIYVCGDLEYYLDNKTSLRGEGFYFFNATNKDADVKLIMNHSIFSGVLFHIPTKWNIDPYFSVLPGLALTQVEQQISGTPFVIKSNPDVSPLISPVLGIQYFAPKFFHLFANVRYIKGMHLGNTERYQLDEVRFTFGLGFNLALIKS
jgi:hypothetical protein